MQAERVVGDAWWPIIEQYVEELRQASVGEILEHALQVEKSRWTQADQNRVARLLKQHGWQRVQRRVGAQRPWVYVSPRVTT